MTERKHGLYIISLFHFFILLTDAQDSNHFFCGSSWGDASGNVRHIMCVCRIPLSPNLIWSVPFFCSQCDDREHCPGGTDDECSTEGHICFGGTSCDVKLGHGNKFKYANVDYNDISNTRFCGLGWNEAIDSCSIERHCPSGFSDECPQGMSCYGGLKCNVQDMYEEEAKKKEESGVIVNSIPGDDERRNMFCGINWADASKKCSVWSVFTFAHFAFAIELLLILLAFILTSLFCSLRIQIMQQYANDETITTMKQVSRWAG